KSTTEPESECKMDMSPMIDMVFLLLIFFIVNATAIIVQTDPEVKPPIAKNSKRQIDGSGRIVINVHEDGTCTAEDFRVILQDEDAIYDLVKKMKERNDRLTVESKLHLRGDKDTVFRHSRNVIRAAARAGVNQVVFAVFTREPK
ncbi:MAG: ExbD/TolR family protein, partial [Luteolibacter sp.]